MQTLRSLRKLRRTLKILKLFKMFTDSVFQAVQLSLTGLMSCDLDAILVAKTP